MVISERAWCYYRNMVHTVYREVRHAGPPGDREARLEVADPDLTRSLASLRKWRETLKGTRLFEKVRTATATTAVREPYEAVTYLSLDQVRSIFGLPGWRPMYGGPRWEAITALAIELGEAIDSADGGAAERLCDEIRAVRHNSGPLVPDSAHDQNVEKWPCLCD